jgi:hypothetical protein
MDKINYLMRKKLKEKKELFVAINCVFSPVRNFFWDALCGGFFGFENLWEDFWISLSIF